MDTQHTSVRGAADGRKINLADAPTGAQGERLLAAGERLGMRLWVEERPVQGPVATREHETVGFALKGRATLILGDRRIELAPGDSWVVPAGAPHSYRIEQSFAAVEATSPPPHGDSRALRGSTPLADVAPRRDSDSVHDSVPLRDSGASMASHASASRAAATAGATAAAVGTTSASSTSATQRSATIDRRPPQSLSAGAAAQQYGSTRPQPSRATEADGPFAPGTPAARVGAADVGVVARREAAVEALDASVFARRHARTHDLARRMHGTPASVFALLRGGAAERLLPEVPPGRDYVRMVGDDRRLEWGASDDTWHAWLDVHPVHGNVVEVQARVTTAYDLGDPRAPSASEVTTGLRALLDAIRDGLDDAVGDGHRAAR